MLPGPDRTSTDHGGKIFLPASALDKLTTLHITYPMLFELINGAKSTRSHSGVLEFIAEEGRCYLPYWIMKVLHLEPGDLLQIKSTDLPPGTYIKLQPQSTSFLDISDPKAVLEMAFRNFSCLSVNDVFTFSYNDEVYEIKVLEVKPEQERGAISVQETDLSVDFAEPVGYKEEMEKRQQDEKKSDKGKKVGHANVHSAGGMAQAINYAAITPVTDEEQKKVTDESVSFGGVGRKLKKGAKEEINTPVGEDTSTASKLAAERQKRNGAPMPLRLPENKLFLGFPIIPLKKKDGEETKKVDRDWSEGQTLRKKK